MPESPDEPGGARVVSITPSRAPSLQKTTRRSLIWVGILPILLAALAMWSRVEFKSVDAWVAHTENVIVHIDSIFASIQAAENGTRGYLLTGNQDFLKPYLAASSRIDSQLRELHALTIDNPRQTAYADDLQARIHERLDVFKQPIELRWSQASGVPPPIFRGTRGIDAMGRIQAIIDGMKKEELRLLKARKAQLNLMDGWVIASQSLGIVAILFLLVRTWLVVGVYERKTQSAEQETLALNEGLERKVEARTLELHRSHDFAHSIVERVPQPLLVLDAELRIKSANRAFYECFRGTPESSEGHFLYVCDGGSWDVPALRTLLAEVIGANKSFDDFEMEGEFAHAGHRVLVISARQLDKSRMILFSISDLTERRKAEEGLRAADDRLHRAQKMEAVGRLAGGIAHDFNNLLTSILGYSDILLDSMGTDDNRHDRRRRIEGVQIIKESAERASELTKQLLAFSGRQVLQPNIFTLKSVVADMARMLPRVLGDHISLVTGYAAPDGFILADAGQVGQVIMYLALNARDAMADGGTLTIATQSVEIRRDTPRNAPANAAPNDPGPGRYVVLEVKDTGAGMDKETQSHLFEPFFTTKGLGSGMGLATVLGIVEQSGAHIRFTSAPGQGTTFTLHFPSVAEPAHARVGETFHQPSGPLSELPSGSELVLVTEDEPAILTLARKFLETKGYQVLEAKNGVDALAICKIHPHIDLLLSDVRMPEMGGRELAELATALNPEMKVLFMSGYPDDSLIEEGIKEGAPFLQKPFTLPALAKSVRDVLDGKAREQTVDTGERDIPGKSDDRGPNSFWAA